MNESKHIDKLIHESVAPHDLSSNSHSARQAVFDARFISSLCALVCFLLGVITVSWNWVVGSYFFIGSAALIVMTFFIIDHIIFYIDQQDTSKAKRNLVLWMVPGFTFTLIPGFSLLRAYSNLSEDVEVSGTIEEKLSYPPEYYRELYSRTKISIE